MTDERVPPPRLLKPLNRVLMIMLRLGLPVPGAEAPVILTVTGRRSGKPRSTPITPMHIDGNRYVVSCYPGADWARNVRAADDAALRQGRRSERVRMVELAPDEARPVLREFATKVPTGVDLMKRVGVLADGSPDELESVAGRLPVFRIDTVT
ncbi:nitroreductase family deazaflavin-dependent oxidoreductase [Mycobacterium sp. URHB0021]